MTNHDLAVQFLRTMFADYGGGYIELRFFDAYKRRSRCFHEIGNEYLAATQCVDWDDHGWDVYFGVLPRETKKDGTKRNIARARWAWADVDAKRHGTMPAACAAAERERPDILVCSGGGYHPYWQLTREIDVSTPERVQAFESQLDALQKRVNSDPVNDTSRILRVPGTHNRKPTFATPPLVIAEYSLPVPPPSEAPARPETPDEALRRWQDIVQQQTVNTVACRYAVIQMWLHQARAVSDSLQAERRAAESAAFVRANRDEIPAELLGATNAD